MKTVQLMKRKLLGLDVEQRTSDEYFKLSSVEKACSFWRMSKGLGAFNVHAFLRTNATEAFVSALDARLGAPSVKRSGVGKGHHVWVHPYVMLEVAFAMSPDLKVDVYGWIYDELVKYRNTSGDSYKKMTGALYPKFTDTKRFQRFIGESANDIRAACGVVDDWNQATEQQLRLRDRIHDTVAILADVVNDPKQVVRMGIVRATGEMQL